MRVRAAALLLLAPLSSAWAGELSDRYQKALGRVLSGEAPRYDAALLLADVIPDDSRRFTNFSGDISGRYLGALAAAGVLEAPLALLPRVLEHQRADGRFGNPLSNSGATDDDMSRLWGAGRMLIGLVELHEASGDERALDAARRLADWLVAHGDRFNAASVRDTFSDGHMATGYICWTQNIEGLARLGALTGDRVYLDLAREMAARVERRQGQHSHGWLSSLRGVLDLYEATGEQRWLEQVEADWEAFAASDDLLPSGGVAEYFGPDGGRDEGCSEADLVRLTLQLWRLTRDTRYIEAAERAMFNAFYGNQLLNGGFGHQHLSERGFDHGRAEAWWCCNLHGVRAFPAVRDAAFRDEDGAVFYDLAVDARHEAGGMVWRAESERPGAASITVEQGRGAAKLAIRAEAARVSLNGEDVLPDARDGYLTLDRAWVAGDVVAVEYDYPVTVERGVVRRGPWVLGVAEDVSPQAFHEPYMADLLSPTSLTELQRPWGATARLEAAGFAGDFPVEMRPLGDRYQLGGMRWQYLFGEVVNPHPEPWKYGRPKYLWIAAGIGAVVATLLCCAVWVWRRRTAG